MDSSKIVEILPISYPKSSEIYEKHIEEIDDERPVIHQPVIHQPVIHQPVIHQSVIQFLNNQIHPDTNNNAGCQKITLNFLKRLLTFFGRIIVILYIFLGVISVIVVSTVMFFFLGPFFWMSLASYKQRFTNLRDDMLLPSLIISCVCWFFLYQVSK